MPPTTWPPSKYYKTFGEKKFITVIGVIFVVLLMWTVVVSAALRRRSTGPS